MPGSEWFLLGGEIISDLKKMFKICTSKGEALLTGRMDLGPNIINGVGGLILEVDALASKDLKDRAWSFEVDL